MLLRAEFVSLAMRMQEIADGKVDSSEAGARNSKRDLSMLQAIHDHAGALGANCSMMYEAAKPVVAAVENVPRETSGSLQLVESFNFAESEALQLLESADLTRREIKIIAPGKGSSAFYPAEVLQRDGPQVFGKGTHIYINHATKAEEAARPEGDWHKLVGALDAPAYWKESGKHGPGLYGMAAFAPDVAPAILAKAPWSGMSIRANGDAVMEAGRPALKEGLPVLARLISAQSVDIVTRAGAGGMILTEAATPQIQEKQESGMDEAAVQKLIESAVKAAQAPLLERAIRGDAREEATRILTGVTLQEASKARVIDLVLSRELPVTEGALDTAKFTELVNAEAKREGAYVASLTGAGKVTGMGITTVVDPAVETQLHEASVKTHKRALNVFADFGLPADVAKMVANGFGEAA